MCSLTCWCVEFKGKIGWWERSSGEETVAELTTGEERVSEWVEAAGTCAAQKCGEFVGILCTWRRKAACLSVCG